MLTPREPRAVATAAAAAAATAHGRELLAGQLQILGNSPVGRPAGQPFAANTQLDQIWVSVAGLPLAAPLDR